MDFTKLAKVEHKDQLILTTEQLAEFYECTTDNIKKNFNVNKERFIEGKHYFKIEGEALKNLRVTFSNLQISAMTRTLYLWTKRGAARHAKMLSTEKAWEVFELLEDNYFNAQEKVESAPKNETQIAVQNSVEMKLIVAPALKDMEVSVELIERLYGVKHGIALATCKNAVEKNHGVDLSAFDNLLPAAEHEIGRFTPTQIAKKIGLKSAQAVNKKLVEFGLQEKDGNSYILTEKGKEYGEAMPFNNDTSGHSGYQLKWSAAVFYFFEQDLKISA